MKRTWLTGLLAAGLILGYGLGYLAAEDSESVDMLVAELAECREASRSVEESLGNVIISYHRLLGLTLKRLGSSEIAELAEPIARFLEEIRTDHGREYLTSFADSIERGFLRDRSPR